MMLIEQAPFGVIGSITPSTNPTSTVISNSISMITAGNAVVFNPQPRRQESFAGSYAHAGVVGSCGVVFPTRVKLTVNVARVI